MKRALQVCLGEEGRLVGDLRYDQQGAREHAAFTYDATWLATPEGFALEPGLPLVAGAQFHRKVAGGSVFHAAIADTEPDGWGRRVIQRDHAKRRQGARRAGKETGSAQLTAMDYLLAVDDGSRVGALRLRDEAGVFQRATEAGRRTTPPLVELKQLIGASRAVETETETAADLAYLRGRGTSLGGLRPKCSVIDDDGSFAIAKFPSVQPCAEPPVCHAVCLLLRGGRASGPPSPPRCALRAKPLRPPASCPAGDGPRARNRA